jgi:hypothetical protein
MRQNCERCKFWRDSHEFEVDGNKTGSCHRRAPVLFDNRANQFTVCKTAWPEVWSNEFCGEWEMKP